jgi:hypothetical protein
MSAGFGLQDCLIGAATQPTNFDIVKNFLGFS